MGVRFIIVGMLLLNASVYAQQNRNGILIDANGNPVAGANLLLQKKSGLVIAFTTSDTKGKFSWQIPTNLPADSLIVAIYAAGIDPYIISLSLLRSPIILSRKLLPDVVVTATAPVVVRNDTITYDAKSFADNQDRVIADVIRRLPGIEVTSSGNIRYKGKSITHFYIEGDDLLGGRYNLATNNIPVDALEKVQVLENHQPIKALKDKIFSDEPAMNILLNDKTKIKLIHILGAAAGPPSNYDVDYSNMLFRKKIKSLNLLTLNNTGNDISSNLRLQTSQNIDYKESAVSNTPFLSVSGMAGYPIDKSRYTFNNAKLLTGNILTRFSSDLTLKINTSYLGDLQDRASLTLRKYFLPTDTISYSEKVALQMGVKNFITEINLNRNTDKHYFDNTLVFEQAQFNDLASVITNVSPSLKQQLGFRKTVFSNYLKWVQSNQKNWATEYSSYISNNNLPQSLANEPGLYVGFFNKGNPYSIMQQKIELPVFYTVNSVRVSKVGKILNLSLKAGTGYLYQKLSSAIALIQTSGASTSPVDSFRNELSWKEFFAFSDASMVGNFNKVRISLSFPVRMQFIDYSDHFKHQAINRYLFYNLTPQFNFQYNFKNTNRLFGGVQYKEQPGTIFDVFSGFIMRDYRAFTASAAPLFRNQNYNGSLGFTYSRAAQFVTLTAFVSHGQSDFRYVFDNILSDSLQFAVKRAGAGNRVYNTNLNLKLSKYFFPVRTNINLGITLSQNTFNQFQNGTFLWYESNTLSTLLSVYTKISGSINVQFESIIDQFQNEQTNRNVKLVNPAVTQLRQQLQLNWKISESISLKTTTNSYNYRVPGQAPITNFFTDASLLIRPKKIKTDIEIAGTNLFNNAMFNAAYQNDNLFRSQQLQLRDRIILIKAGFRF